LAVKERKRPAAHWPFFYSGCFVLLLESDQPHTGFSPLSGSFHHFLEEKEKMTWKAHPGYFHIAGTTRNNAKPTP
jgi:hypothetical protein